MKKTALKKVVSMFLTLIMAVSLCAGFSTGAGAASGTITAEAQGTYTQSSNSQNVIIRITPTGVAKNYCAFVVDGGIMLPAGWNVVEYTTNAPQAITSGDYNTANGKLTYSTNSGEDEIPADAYYEAIIEIPANTVGNYEVVFNTVQVADGYGANVLVEVAKLTAVVSINSNDISSAVIGDIPTYTYDGTAKAPTPTVTLDGSILTAGVDFDYSYSNNVNAGTNTATVTITGKGNYTGTASKTFTITPADITLAVNITGWTYGEYNAANNSPSVTGNNGNGSVTYQYKVKGAADSTYTSEIPTEVGNYIVKAAVASTGNYNGGSATAEFAISANDISGAVIGDIPAYTYDGTAKAPTPAVTLGGKTLTVGVDFDYSYSNNVNAGTNTATVTITGKGNYTGTASKTFTINKAGQTIIGAHITVKVGKTFDLSSVFSAQGALSYSITEGATVSGTILTAGNIPGTYDLTVSAAATENYKAVTKGYSVTVTAKDTQHITVVDQDDRAVGNTMDLTYGDKNKSIVATSAEIQNAVVSYAIKDGSSNVITIDGDGNINVVGAGTATLVVTVAGDGDYADAIVEIVVTVAPKQIVAPTASNTVYTYTGAEQIYSIRSTDDYTVTGNVQTNAGNHVVTVALKDKANTVWADSSDTADKTFGFNIKKAPLTIKADSYMIEAGDDAPVLDANSYVVSGLKGNDTLAGIRLVVSVAYASVPDTDVAGTYAIVVSGAAETDNYTVTYVNGTLTIEAKNEPNVPIIPPVLRRYTLTFETNGGSAIRSITKVAYTNINLMNYVTVKDGYEFAGWYTDAALTKQVTSVRLSRNMTVYAKWIKSSGEGFVCHGGANCPSKIFTDVDQTQWYHESIDFVVATGLMNGIGNNKFDPYGVTSRAMFVTILYRLEGKPTVTEENPFSDVEEDTWYTDAVIWAAANGIVKGYGEGLFGPEDEVTREQMAKIMYNYAEYKDYDVSARASLESFADADEISSWAVEEMQWAVAVGLINGMGDDTVAPQADAERCQIAAVFMRFIKKFVM